MRKPGMFHYNTPGCWHMPEREATDRFPIITNYCSKCIFKRVIYKEGE